MFPPIKSVQCTEHTFPNQGDEWRSDCVRKLLCESIQARPEQGFMQAVISCLPPLPPGGGSQRYLQDGDGDFLVIPFILTGIPIVVKLSLLERPKQYVACWDQVKTCVSLASRFNGFRNCEDQLMLKDALNWFWIAWRSQNFCEICFCCIRWRK